MMLKECNFEGSDCLWLILEAKRQGITFPTLLLREIDWQTRGGLARIVCDVRPVSQTVFLPTGGGGRLPVKMVAIDTVKTFEAEKFQKNVAGLKAEKTVILFENEKVKVQIETDLAKQKKSQLFKNCRCVEDQP